jgi:hypothetical protein
MPFNNEYTALLYPEKRKVFEYHDLVPFSYWWLVANKPMVARIIT